jgi:hypothetical protein
VPAAGVGFKWDGEGVPDAAVPRPVHAAS